MSSLELSNRFNEKNKQCIPTYRKSAESFAIGCSTRAQ